MKTKVVKNISVTTILSLKQSPEVNLLTSAKRIVDITIKTSYNDCLISAENKKTLFMFTPHIIFITDVIVSSGFVLL